MKEFVCCWYHYHVTKVWSENEVIMYLVTIHFVCFGVLIK